jgi:hypothetical protein
MHLGSGGGEIHYILSDEEPSENIGFLFRGDDPAITLATTAHVWARACLSNVYASAIVAPLRRRAPLEAPAA